MSRGPEPAPIEDQARNAVLQASWLVAQRALDLVRALAFALLVPRLLGPEDFGRFALLGSAAQWFAVLTGLGTAQLMARFVPVMILREDPAAVRRLLGSLLVLRIVTGVGAAALYLLVGRLWLKDLPLGLLATVAAAVAIGSVARVPFAFFLGLNQAARWGVGESVRHWSSLVLVTAGALALGVPGACLGLALGEVLVLLLGLWWLRGHVSSRELALDRQFLAPYLRHSLAFFGGNLLVALTERGGEVVVRAVQGDYAQVGYFGLAAAAWLLAAHGAWVLLLSFLPLLTRLRAQGRALEAARWAERLLKALTAAGVVACFAAALVGPDLVRWLVGAAFRSAGPLLLPITLALLAQVAGGVGRLMTLTLDRPRPALVAALAAATSVVGLGLPLGARFGAVGVAWTMAVAMALHAGVILGAVRRSAPLALGGWLGVAGLGALLFPLALLPVSGPASRGFLLVALAGGYAVALHRWRLLTTGDLAALRRALAPATPGAP